MSFPWSQNHALGLPKGSVRALMTMMLLVGWTVAILSGSPVPELYTQLVMGALALYFGPRVIKGATGETLELAKKFSKD